MRGLGDISPLAANRLAVIREAADEILFEVARLEQVKLEGPWPAEEVEGYLGDLLTRLETAHRTIREDIGDLTRKYET